MGRKPSFDIEEVKALVREGMSPSAIARLVGVSRQAVTLALNREGFTFKRDIPDFPFEVPSHLQHGSTYKALRNLGDFHANGPDSLSAYQKRRLRLWLDMLRAEKLVVEFDPEAPADAGKGSKGGWKFHPREESDGNLVIRENRFTNLTERGRQIYVFPKAGP